MLLALVALSFAFLAGLSALVVRLMIGRGVLDIPGARSSHDRPTPKGGGIGIAAAFVLGVLAAAATGRTGADPVPALGVAAASLLLASVAWADDLRQFRFGWKLLGQVGAGLLLVGTGFVLHRIGPVALGHFGIPLTLALVLFLTNALNFIDGLNGLAAGSALVVALACGAAALHTAGQLLAAMALSLAAGLAGFLPFNYPRARIFMGDVGSQLCGLVLAAITTISAPLLPAGRGIALPLLGLAAIILDVGFTLVRRLVAGDRVTEAHRGHLYQLAVRAGVEARLVSAIYWVLALLGIVVAVRSGPGVIAGTAIVVAAFGFWAAITLALARGHLRDRW